MTTRTRGGWYSDFFAHNGFRTAAAADGLAALSLAKSLDPDVIVLDIHMPRLDGIGALKLMRRHEPLRNTPVVVLTLYDFHETEALAAGATALARQTVHAGVVAR